MCICDYVKNRIGSFYNLCFDVKKGYKWINVLGSCKTNCSRKRETREERGKNEGARINIKKNTPAYVKLNQVLQASENKTELLSLVADTLVENFQHKRDYCSY